MSFSIEARHASPHKFRDFSTDKMGTGEGHQAFGWGLYFSRGRESNEHYYRQFASYRMMGLMVLWRRMRRQVKRAIVVLELSSDKTMLRLHCFFYR